MTIATLWHPPGEFCQRILILGKFFFAISIGRDLAIVKLILKFRPMKFGELGSLAEAQAPRIKKMASQFNEHLCLVELGRGEDFIGDL